jgi:GTP cyclohydrolase I
MEISKIIKQRLIDNKVQFFANDNISEYISNDELDLLQEELQEKIQSFLETLIIDTDNDHNTKDTAKRVAKMYLREICAGRYFKTPNITEFPNVRKLDQIYTVGPISVRSLCSHHLQPITGECWIGVIPGENVIGLSKFSRVVDHILSRPSIQEESIMMIADKLEELIKPRGLGVIIDAHHGCMSNRGVKDPDTKMVNSVMRGCFKDDMNTRQEFLRLIGK